MKRRLAALALAAAMVVGSSVTVYAEGANVTDMAEAAAGQEVTGSGTMNLPEIKVTVPTTANIVINPYQMDYESSDKSLAGSKQIISAEQEIVNESNVAIAVNVADLTATDVSEGVNISTAALGKTTTKSALLYLEVVADGANFAANGYDSKLASQVVVPYVKDGDTKTKKGAKDAIVTLDKKVGDTATKAKFTIGGAVVANPTKVNEDKSVSADPWTSADTIGISFKFTFTPQVATSDSKS